MTTVYMPNGEMELLLSHNDLIDLVRKNIGFEAGLMIEEIVKNSDIEEKKMNSDFRSYEMQLEDNHQAFEDLSNLIGKATCELNKDRMNKAKMKKLIEKMEDLVKQNL